MWRILHLVAIAALIGSAVYAYSIKYETILFAEQIAKTKHRIEDERNAIAMLRAEWAHLTRPERIQALALKHLDSQPLQLTQIAGLADLPQAAPRVDTIGRKLEDLGIGGPTAAPRDPVPAGGASTLLAR
jgi:cell division protein FtsL